MTRPEPEPWLRGAIPGIPLHVMPAFFSFAQVREDLEHHTAGITDEQVWRPIVDKHSLGYHLNHIAGSVDRLTSYLVGDSLSDTQLQFLKSEHSPDGALAALLLRVDSSLDIAENQLLAVKLESLFESRTVGRNQLPTTLYGLLVHVCEHTQRHLGQAILLTKILRQT